MKIWLITSGEPIPSKDERPHRVGILSEMLANKNVNVIWWTTTFDHQKKEYLHNKNYEVSLNANCKRFYLHSKTSYTKNISINRILNHKQVAKSFEIEANKKEIPDVIFCSFPTIDLSYEAVKYGVKFKVPVIVDVRDLWPDIFFNPFPKLLHPIIKLGLSKYTSQTKYIFKNCHAVTGVSEKYLDFGLNYGGRTRTSKDKVFPLGYDSEGKKNIVIDESEYDHLNISSEKINIWFVGTFGKTYDLSTVIEVAKKLEKTTPEINFIFTGDGENMKLWKKQAGLCKNIVFTGWVGKKELHYISLMSSIGLMAYSKGAPQGLPNKVFEYMASGLPILSSLQSETKDLLLEERIGKTYEAENPEDLYSKLKSMVADSKQLREMGKRSEKVFQTKFDSTIVYENLIDYLKKQKKK